jgi:hypothetical protein
MRRRVAKRPTSARAKLSGKNFHLGMRVGAWRKPVPLSHLHVLQRANRRHG